MDEFLTQYLNFEDWVDEDPYAEVPLHWFESLDKVLWWVYPYEIG
jgi:hypothetical protein